MFKKSVLLLAFIALVTFSQAQTLKITDVQASNNKLWNDKTKALLGKKLSLTFYDRTVRIMLPDTEPLVLAKDNDDSYSGLDNLSTQNESFLWKLTTQTAVRFITKATVTLTISQLKPPYRSAVLTITAKRF